MLISPYHSRRGGIHYKKDLIVEEAENVVLITTEGLSTHFQDQFSSYTFFFHFKTARAHCFHDTT